jgi:branched-chain amino acid aminotransferase
MSPEFLIEADEIFMTGNLNKILPVTKIEDKELGIGEMSTTIRDLYFNWCKTLPKIH